MAPRPTDPAPSETHRRLAVLQLLEQDPELARLDAELCRQDPVHWIESWGWATNPRAERPEERDVPLRLWPDQRRMVAWLLELWRKGLPGLLVKSREIGASWLALHLIFWAWRWQTGFSAHLASRLERYVDDGTDSSLFGKLRYLRDRQPFHLAATGTDKQLHLELRGSTITGEATNPNIGRAGRHSILLLDEFAFVPPRVAAAIWKAQESVARTTWLITTPDSKAHKAYQLYQQLPAEQVLTLDWHADPRRGEDWRSARLRNLSPEEFAQEYECQWGVSRVGLIWTHQADVLTYDDFDSRWLEVAHVQEGMIQAAGWDFGTGESLLVCFHGLVDYSIAREKPRLWIRNEHVFRRTEWRTAAATVLEDTRRFKGRASHFGDPAGANAESDQGSWETHLRSGGIPLFCLDSWFNTREGIEWTIREVQTLIDDERLFIHRRCRYLLEVLAGWKRAISEHADPDLIDKAYIPPRKDLYSHGGDALRYLAGGLLRFAVKRPIRERRPHERDDEPELTLSAQIARWGQT